MPPALARPVGTPRARRRRRSSRLLDWLDDDRRKLRRLERSVLIQDRAIQLLQRGPGIDAQLLDERLSGIRVRVEGLRLPSGTVEREHQLAAQALTQRMGAGQPLDLAHEPPVEPARRDRPRSGPRCRRGEAPRVGRSRIARMARRGSRRVPGHARERAPRGARRSPLGDQRRRGTDAPARPACSNRVRSTRSGSRSRTYPGERLASSDAVSPLPRSGSSSFRRCET